MMKKALALFLCLTILVPVCPASADSEIPYKYDANGNLVSGDGKYFEYNDANKLVRVRLGDANGAVLAEYVYDHAGQRIKKIENGVTTYYVGKLYEEEYTGGLQTGKASYYFANGQRVAKKDKTGKMFYIHADHLGGTNVVTDESGNQVERTKYYPFGDIREGGNERYSFTGKEKDKATDFYYFEARHYNPGYRHFTQADIIVPNAYDPQSLNRYAYVKNNPLKFVDPSGMYNIKNGTIEKGDSKEDIVKQVNKAFNIKTDWETIAKVSNFDPNLSIGDLVKKGEYTAVGTDRVKDITVNFNLTLAFSNYAFDQLFKKLKEQGINLDSFDKLMVYNMYFQTKDSLFYTFFPSKYNGIFDLKNFQDGLYGYDSQTKKYYYNSFIYNGKFIRHDAPGNILAGFFANKFDISISTLKNGAAFTNFLDNGSFKDDPVDTEYLTMGYDMYSQSCR